MKNAFKQTLGSWSFSRYNDYVKCPLRAKLKHIDKMKEPPSLPMQRGAAIATASEHYLKKKTNRLATELASFSEEYKWLRKQPTLFVEEMWGFDAAWNPVAWNDWNNCKLRVKVDIGWQTDDGGVHIRDGKTGKFREEKNVEYVEQLELYTAAAISQFPTATYITTELWYTDQGMSYPEKEPMETTPEKATGLQKEWDKRVKKMLADTTFKPKPSSECRWCSFSSSKGGPCKY